TIDANLVLAVTVPVADYGRVARRTETVLPVTAGGAIPFAVPIPVKFPGTVFKYADLVDSVAVPVAYHRTNRASRPAELKPPVPPSASVPNAVIVRIEQPGAGTKYANLVVTQAGPVAGDWPIATLAEEKLNVAARRAVPGVVAI